MAKTKNHFFVSQLYRSAIWDGLRWPVLLIWETFSWSWPICQDVWRQLLLHLEAGCCQLGHLLSPPNGIQSSSRLSQDFWPGFSGLQKRDQKAIRLFEAWPWNQPGTKLCHILLAKAIAQIPGGEYRLYVLMGKAVENCGLFYNLSWGLRLEKWSRAILWKDFYSSLDFPKGKEEYLI